MKIEINVTGASNLESQLVTSVGEQLQEQYAAELEDYRCPDHAQPIEGLTIGGDSLKSMSVQITACCDRATEEASEILAND